MTDRARGGHGSNKHSDYYNEEQNLLGNYQYISIKEIIANFTAVYVGENKILANVLDGDVNYHAHRALQELSYDTLKSCKTQEIILPPSLQMRLPHDYVNYTKITWSDSNGIEHIIYPTSKTGNHNTIQQDSDGNYKLAKSHNHKNKGLATLIQDHNGGDDEHSNELELEDGYGTKFTTVGNGLSANYSGPFRLHSNYLHYNGSGLNQSSEEITEPFLKDGMEIFHIGMQPGTTITNVAVVEKPPNTGDFTTEFYLSKPTKKIQEVYTGSNKNYVKYVSFDDISGSTTWGKYKSASNGSTGITTSQATLQSFDYYNYFNNSGQRRGLDPQYAQSNGSFFINHSNGKVHFSSDLAGKNIILHYLSDHNAESGEAIVHKFAEEAMYKHIAYGCAQARTDVPPPIVQRLKQERSAETRKAKIRLSNIKIEEISQIMRGKSKFLDH